MMGQAGKGFWIAVGVMAGIVAFGFVMKLVSTI